MAKKELSKNFDEQMAKRDQPGCYGKYKTTSEQKPKKCGMCWFAHNCKKNKNMKQKDLGMDK